MSHNSKIAVDERKAWTTPELGLLDDPRNADDVSSHTKVAGPNLEGGFLSYPDS